MKLRWLLFTVVCSLFSVLLLLPPPARASCRVIESGDECTSFGDVPTQYTLPDNESVPNSACPNPAAVPGKPYNLCCLDDNLGEQQQYGRYFSAQELATSTDALRSPICNSAVETIPSCASCFDGGQLNCSGYDFSVGKYDQSIEDYFDQGGANDDLPPEVIDPDGDGKFMYNGQVYDTQAVYACRENLFACGAPGCTPNFKYEQPRGSSAAEIELDQAVAAGKLCYQVEIKDPHPLRPAPALACQKQVPEPWGLSCANDAVPIVTIGRPRTTTHPGDSDQGPKYETACSFDGPYGRANCTRFELLTKNIIGEVDVTIDLTGLELPIAGIASRNCDTGKCDVDEKKSDGKLRLTDGYKMRNYTSWYLQGAIEQSEQEPLDYFDAGDTLKRVLAYAGPIKKLIPEESLDAEKRELIAMVENNKSYNAIVGYIDAGQVISRRQAREKGLTDKSHTVRVKDMPKYNPNWDPHSHDGNIGYYLWRQMPFTGKDLARDEFQNAGQVDVAGEIFPTACLKSQTNLEGCSSGPCRCQSDEKVLDAQFKVTSGLESFKVWYPHLVEDETLLASLLQKALVSSDIPQTGGYPTFSQLNNNLAEVNRKPEWTEADGHAWINADGCKRENALWNEGDSLEAKRSQTKGLIKGKLKFKREVEYSYQAETDASEAYIDECKKQNRSGCPELLSKFVDVPAKSPIPVHIRYSHMNEIGDLTVFGKGSIFKALYPNIPETIGPEIPERPAESSIAYRCTAKNGSCKASSTSHKNQPMAFFPRWGSTLELFHQKIQCMLDPLQQGCNQPTPSIIPPIIPPGGIGGPTPPGDGTGALTCNIPMRDTSCQPIDWGSAFIQAYVDAYNKNNNSSWTLVEEPWAQQMIEGNSGGLCPGFLLTLWLEESGGSAVGSYDLGCIYPLGGGGQQTRKNQHPISDAEVLAMPAADRCYHGLCARTLQEYRQSILGEQMSCLNAYTNAIGDFQTFMCQYSGEADTDPNTPYRQCTEFKNNPNFPVNICKIWAALGYPPKP